MPRRFAAALTLALTATLAACGSGQLPEPSAEPAPATPTAVIEVAHLEQILQQVGETLAAADAASNGDQLAGRVSGPAEAMRRAEYQLAAASGGENAVTPLVTDAQVEIVAATDGWPRVVHVVTVIPEGTNLPLLLTLVQPEARANYTLWSWVRLLPGVQMPLTVNAAAGSPVLPPDSDALRVTPAQAVEYYADLLDQGADSEFVDLFAADAFRETQEAELSNLNDAVSAVASAEQSWSVNDAGTYSLGTDSGGAIVVGVLDKTLSVQRTVAGSSLTVGAPFSFNGSSAVKGTLSAAYLVTVAFYVPPAGSEEQIQVLGAEAVLTGVTRDDSTSPD